MQVKIAYGLQHLDLDVPERDVAAATRDAPVPALADPAGAVGAALNAPFDFPALRQALTSDDHVVIVVDEHLPHLARLVCPVVEHILSAGVQAEAITLLCPPSTSRQRWLDDLPEALQEVRVEVHDPGDHRHLSYLATSKQDRRLYLNRTAVDADQLVVLAGRRYDPLLGIAGGADLLYPALSDEETRLEVCARLSAGAPGDTPWPVRQEATEAAWLLGAPFLVQIIEGAGDDIAHVVAGPVASSTEGDRLLNARWRVTVDKPARTVVASLSGDPARHDFAALARALAAASRVVEADGRIILLSQGQPALGSGTLLLAQADDPERGLELLRDQKPPDMAAAFQWATAAHHTKVYLLSDLPADLVEGLYAIPLEEPGQVQRLLGGEESYLFLEDAHKALALTPQVQHAPRRVRANRS